MPTRERPLRLVRLLTALAVTTVTLYGCGASETSTVTAQGSPLGQPIRTAQAAGPASTRPSPPTSTSARWTTARARNPEAIHLPSDPTRTTPRSRAILATASRFATAYLHYQIGQDPPSVQQAIRASCARSFAHSLLSQPVSVPNAQRSNFAAQAPSLDHLTYTGPASLGAGPPVQIVLARYHTIRHPGVGGLLTIEIAGTGSSWRVTGLG